MPILIDAQLIVVEGERVGLIPTSTKRAIKLLGNSKVINLGSDLEKHCCCAVHACFSNQGKNAENLLTGINVHIRMKPRQIKVLFAFGFHNFCSALLKCNGSGEP